MNDYAGTILVVDDEPTNVEMLSRRLQRHNYAVDAAYSGQEALERLVARSYDVTLLDAMMPGLDGLGVLRNLRNQPINARTPVIMVTAKSGSDDVAEAFGHGADDFVAKPIDFCVLLARLKTQIARHRAYRQIETLNRKLTETVATQQRTIEDMQKRLAAGGDRGAITIRSRSHADDHQVEIRSSTLDESAQRGTAIVLSIPA